MGWKGTMRSISAAMRATERDAQRNRKIALKSQIASSSAEAVSEHEAYLEQLISIHTEIPDKIDWVSLASKPRPIYPTINSSREFAAKKELAAYKPSVMDRFRGGSEKRLRKLEAAVAEAKQQDERNFGTAVQAYKADIKDWEEDVGLAKRLVAGEGAALKEVILEMQSLTSESLVGSRIDFELDDDFVHAKPTVHTQDIVPRTRRKQLASGALSESRMPDSTFNDLYQDYVCSVALRVAGDLFNITPISELYVTCFAEMLNTSTGHDEKTPILSVHFMRSKYSTLRLASIDPSDAISSFRHTMDFKRSRGFAKVSPLVLRDSR